MTTSKKKKRKQQTTLSNHISPIPDYSKSADAFNELSGDSATASSGLAEALNKNNLDIFKMEIVTTTIDYMNHIGYSEDEATAYSDFDIEEVDGVLKVEVRCELSYDESTGLLEWLDTILEDRGIDTYFDIDAPGIFSTYIPLGVPMSEELTKKLSSADKQKFKKFVDNNDDVDEISTFLTGLLSKSKK